MEQGCPLGCVQNPVLLSLLLLPGEQEEITKLVFSIHFNRN